jgi:RimJ/RimL family protein N-acetyltransferase
MLPGRTCRLEPLVPERHGEELFAAQASDPTGRHWTWLPYGPFLDQPGYLRWLHEFTQGQDPQFYAIRPSDLGRVCGVCAYLRITPTAGTIELGHILLSAPLQQTVAATEALFLMVQQAFDLGYRRVEWKCDTHNAPSRRSAQRLGFTFEGIFRQAQVVKGRNRDTAWFSIIDGEWPSLRRAYHAWLSPDNFDSSGRQRERLGEVIARERGAATPDRGEPAA